MACFENGHHECTYGQFEGVNPSGRKGRGEVVGDPAASKGTSEQKRISFYTQSPYEAEDEKYID